MPTHRTITVTFFMLCAFGTYLSVAGNMEMSAHSTTKEEPPLPLPEAASRITKDGARLQSLTTWRKGHASTWKSLSMTEKTCIHAKYADASSTLPSVESAINVCAEHEHTNE